MQQRLVIANRGEIARRILRAGRERGYAVAVLGTAEDAGTLVRREADAVLEVSSFLAIGDIVAACLRWGATLVHPGYGFLSENAAFAQAVEDAGLGFVGPTPANMRALGGKEAAKTLARACGVPVLEALLSHELAALPQARWGAELAARGLEAPFLVKASGGGGGRGMRVVERLEELPEAIRRAGLEAQASFGDATVFVERYLSAPRHIEIQVFGDGRGGGVHLGERECSLQRRHQKVLEEAPSTVVDAALRGRMGEAALALVRAAAYRGAGTVEFLLDGAGAFHFLEMNTRLQVEHPVTEGVYGVDLVAAQLALAEGVWPADLDSGPPRGVALEARILAEDPRHGFLPTPGPLTVYREPAGPGVRVDSGVAEGDRISGQFDSMIAKLIVRGEDRPQAVARLSRALEAFVILGCTTNLPFLVALSRTQDFLEGRESTAWIGAHLEALNGPLLPEALGTTLAGEPFREALSCALQGLGAPSGPGATFARQTHAELTPGGILAPAAPVLARAGAHAFTLDGVPLHACRLGTGELGVAILGETLRLGDPLATLAPAEREARAASGTLQAPMGGKVLEVRVAEGEAVEAGQLMFVLESMKMQFEITAPRSGRMAQVLVTAGQVLQGPETLGVLEAL